MSTVERCSTSGQEVERKMPVNWPKGVSLPTIEEARKAAQEAKEMFGELVKQGKREGKLKGTDPDFPNRRFTI